MPLMNGLRFIEENRKRSCLRDTSIIMCSTEGKEDDVLRSLALGADAYLIKSFTQNALCVVVENVLRKKAERRSSER